MNFIKIDTNKVKSDTGFVLWVKTPFLLMYSEDQHSIRINGEMLTGDYDLLVSLSIIKRWDDPFKDEMIIPEKKEIIKENILQALNFLGIKATFD